MTTRCCVRVRPYPYIQCYTSVICRFHTLCHHRPQSSTGWERQSCSSITCADAGIGGFRADFRPVLHLGFPPFSTGKIFACGHVAESTTDDSELLSAAPITSRQRRSSQHLLTSVRRFHRRYSPVLTREGRAVNGRWRTDACRTWHSSVCQHCNVPGCCVSVPANMLETTETHQTAWLNDHSDTERHVASMHQ